MKTTIKQVLGIDVSQKELVTCLGIGYDDFTMVLKAHKVFANTTRGFVLLLSWIAKQTDSSLSVRYVMEATGVYHEKLAYFLEEQHKEVSIVLPNKISNYARSLTVKTVTDKTASEAIARFGLERHLEIWKKPSDNYLKIRQLTRERDQLIVERNTAKNQLHAEKSSARPSEKSIERTHNRIMFLTKQEQEIRNEITELIQSDQQVGQQVELLCSLPGVGQLTAAIVLAETNGFDLIRNKRQLISYAGLDVKEKQSGTSIKGQSRISKRGNRYLRKAMHLPALSAVRHDDRYKNTFIRLVGRHGLKMKALVCVQRKLLEMCYIVFKNNAKYDKDFIKKQEATEMEEKKLEMA